jgi:hypothetical protein
MIGNEFVTLAVLRCTVRAQGACYREQRTSSRLSSTNVRPSAGASSHEGTWRPVPMSPQAGQILLEIIERRQKSTGSEFNSDPAPLP